MRLKVTCLAMGVLAYPAIGVYPSTEPDTLFTSVGKFAGASAVAITPLWVLTAKHINGTTFELPGVGVRNVVENYAHPGADLRLLKLDEPVPYWTPILWQDVRKGQAPSYLEQVWIAGFGDNGIVRQDGGGYSWVAKDGNRHKTTNMIEGTTSISFQMWAGQSWLCYYVENDNPTTATGFYGPFGWIPGEGGVASGDSGGGWFVRRQGGYRLIGITSARGAAPNGGTVWDYGGTSFGVALSDPKHRDWIQSILSPNIRRGR